MVRGKVEMKRIEDKVSRQVSFSKRRSGMLKKASELAVLCEVDVAVFVFSPKGKLYEFSTDESMNEILTRYESFKKKSRLAHGIIQEKLALEHRNVINADELTGIIHRQLIEENIKMLDASGLDQLEKDLDTALQHIKIRKAQLKMETVNALKEKNMQLKKENDSMMQKIMEARKSDTEQPQLPVMEIQVIW